MQPRPTSVAARTWKRDDEFYSPDIVFMVEDILFKVARRPFEDGSIAFQAMFSLPNRLEDDTSGIEGQTDENPIHLEGVTKDEFRALLRVMFSPAYGPSRLPTRQEWEHALKLATTWDFDTIREKAIAELSQLVREPTTRIVLARKFDIPNWIEPALISLAQKHTLLVADLQPLGWDTVAKLMQVRESVTFHDVCACRCNYCSVAHGAAASPGGPPSSGARCSQYSLAMLRKDFNYVPKIEEFFGQEFT